MSDKSKTIQQKMTDLQELVSWFQGEDFSLEQAVTKFHEAETAAESIEADLTALKNDITIIKRRFDKEV
jgi:exonuclease VII small subunit